MLISVRSNGSNIELEGCTDILDKTCSTLDMDRLAVSNCKEDHQCTRLDRLYKCERGRCWNITSGAVTKLISRTFGSSLPFTVWIVSYWKKKVTASHLKIISRRFEATNNNSSEKCNQRPQNSTEWGHKKALVLLAMPLVSGSYLPFLFVNDKCMRDHTCNPPSLFL